MLLLLLFEVTDELRLGAFGELDGVFGTFEVVLGVAEDGKLDVVTAVVGDGWAVFGGEPEVVTVVYFVPTISVMVGSIVVMGLLTGLLAAALLPPT